MHKHKLLQSLKPVSRAVSSQTLEVVFSALCSGIGTELASKAILLLKEGKYDELVSLEIDPRSYQYAHAYADDQLIVKFLSKFKDFRHPNLNPRAKAMETFDGGEESCRLTNKRFAELELDPSKEDPSMHSILQNARRKIAKVLGEPNLDRISRGFGWGPGANTSSSGKHTSAYNKFRNRLDVTSNSLVMGHCCINGIPAWVNCQLQTDAFPSVEASLTREAFNVVRGNEIVFVPKSAKTERTIAKEPSVNSFLQKGFGAEIRRKLKLKAGIDLDDQCINQRLALEGSIANKIATIDLQNASGTISQGIVKRLIREDWYTLLDMARSKQGWHPERKHWIYYQQFSSMGNAFTFELESLIFWGISKAVSDECAADVVSVYGDDIIIESKAYDRLVEVLDYCGFTVNKAKSFKDGPFRESCGKDYFNGTEVRPIYLKESLSNVQSIYKLANSIRRYSHRRNSYYGCDLRLRAAWLECVSRLHEPFSRFMIPDGMGDPGLVVNFDEATPNIVYPKDKRTWEGYSFRCLIDTPVKERMKDEHAGYTACLMAAGSEEPFLGSYNLRKMTSPRINTSHTHCWYDLGPWC